MSAGIIGLLIVSIVLSSSAQIMLKVGMSSPHVQAVLVTGNPLLVVGAVATNLQVIIGLLGFGLSVAFWLLVLSRIDVSLAYPFVSLGIVLTVLSGRLLLHEHLSALRVIGLMMIVGGVLIVAASAGGSRLALSGPSQDADAGETGDN